MTTARYEYHGEQLSISEIAKRRNCSPETIRRFVRQHGPQGVYRAIGDASSGGRQTSAKLRKLGSARTYYRGLKG
jgi:transposase